jgi:DNA-binding NarL/FixJ family response regulator
VSESDLERLRHLSQHAAPFILSARDLVVIQRAYDELRCLPHGGQREAELASRLTEQERDVARMIGEGLYHKQIAERLGEGVSAQRVSRIIHAMAPKLEIDPSRRLITRIACVIGCWLAHQHADQQAQAA